MQQDCGAGEWIGDDINAVSWCDPFKSWQRVGFIYGISSTGVTDSDLLDLFIRSSCEPYDGRVGTSSRRYVLSSSPSGKPDRLPYIDIGRSNSSVVRAVGTGEFGFNRMAASSKCSRSILVWRSIERLCFERYTGSSSPARHPISHGSEGGSGYQSTARMVCVAPGTL